MEWKGAEPCAMGTAAMGRVFTGQQARAFTDLAEVIIPPGGEWPSAGEVVVLADMEARCEDTFGLRDAVCMVLDSVHQQAMALEAASFGALPPGRRIEVVKQVEAAAPAEFRKLVECIYEFYYSDPGVQRTVEQRTRFRIRAAVDGVSVAQFEDVLFRVAEVGARERRVRRVEEA